MTITDPVVMAVRPHARGGSGGVTAVANRACPDDWVELDTCGTGRGPSVAISLS